MEMWQLAARLAESEGYEVRDVEGRNVGRVQHLRYERHADHPDSIIIGRRVMLRKRLGRVPFEAIENVDPLASVIVLRISSEAIGRLRE